jgi:hypothetical protein
LYFYIKELFAVFDVEMILDKIMVSKSTKTGAIVASICHFLVLDHPLRGLDEQGERTSVGAGSPWPMPRIGAWGEKEKLHGCS